MYVCRWRRVQDGTNRADSRVRRVCRTPPTGMHTYRGLHESLSAFPPACLLRTCEAVGVWVVVPRAVAPTVTAVATECAVGRLHETQSALAPGCLLRTSEAVRERVVV